MLTETKNALTKQYTKLFAMDNVGLTFTKDALKALAQEAARKGTGARALRAILEKLMLDLMYDLPSRDDILEVTINRAVIDGKKAPMIRRKQDKEAFEAESLKFPNFSKFQNLGKIEILPFSSFCNLVGSKVSCHTSGALT